MSMKGGPTGIAGMIVEEVGGGIQVNLMIAILLFQEDVEVGVGALELEDHTETILTPQNAIETVHLIGEGNHLVPIQDHLTTTGEVNHPLETMKAEQNIESDPGPDQLRLTITLVIGWMKVEKKSPSTRSGGGRGPPPLGARLEKRSPSTRSGDGPGPCPLRTRFGNEVDCHQEFQVKPNQNTKGGPGLDLLKKDITLVVK